MRNTYKFRKINHDVLADLPALADAFGRDPDIVCLYLFGSYARGRPGPVSDIDIAVLLDRDFPSAKLFDKRLDLLSLACAVLKTDEIDLIILNQAPLALCFQVLKKGVVLFERAQKKDQLVDFKTKTLDRYFDFQPLERTLREGLMTRIREGRFGG